MADLELGEIIVFIMLCIPLFASLMVVRKRKEFAKWIPGFFCLFMMFLCTNVEAIILGDVFNFFEHFFAMMAGLTFCAAAVLDLYKSAIKTEEKQITSGGAYK